MPPILQEANNLENNIFNTNSIKNEIRKELKLEIEKKGKALKDGLKESIKKELRTEIHEDNTNLLREAIKQRIKEEMTNEKKAELQKIILKNVQKELNNREAILSKQLKKQQAQTGKAVLPKHVKEENIMKNLAGSLMQSRVTKLKNQNIYPISSSSTITSTTGSSGTTATSEEISSSVGLKAENFQSKSSATSFRSALTTASQAKQELEVHIVFRQECNKIRRNLDKNAIIFQKR